MRCGLLTIDPTERVVAVSPPGMRPSGADVQLWIPGRGRLIGASLKKPMWTNNNKRICSLQVFEEMESDFSARISKELGDIPDEKIEEWIPIFETQDNGQILLIWPEVLKYFQN